MRIGSAEWPADVRLIIRVNEERGPVAVGVASLPGSEQVGIRAALKQLTDVQSLDRWVIQAGPQAVFTFFKVQIGDAFARK